SLLLWAQATRRRARGSVALVVAAGGRRRRPRRDRRKLRAGGGVQDRLPAVCPVHRRPHALGHASLQPRQGIARARPAVLLWFPHRAVLVAGRRQWRLDLQCRADLLWRDAATGGRDLVRAR